jgi:hypothetical protein
MYVMMGKQQCILNIKKQIDSNVKHNFRVVQSIGIEMFIGSQSGGRCTDYYMITEKMSGDSTH